MPDYPRVQPIDAALHKEMDALHAQVAALAWNVRLKLLVLLANEPGDVTFLADRLGFDLCTVSRHLSTLRGLGLVTMMRQKNRRLHALSGHVGVERREGKLKVRVGAGTGSAVEFAVSTKPPAAVTPPSIVATTRAGARIRPAELTPPPPTLPRGRIG